MKKFHFFSLLLLVATLSSFGQSLTLKSSFPSLLYRDHKFDVQQHLTLTGTVFSIWYQNDQICFGQALGTVRYFNSNTDAVTWYDFDPSKYPSSAQAVQVSFCTLYGMGSCTWATKSNVPIYNNKPIWKSIPTRCIGMSQSIDLRNYITKDANAPWGTFSGSGVSSNTFSPESAGVGTHTISYTDGSRYVTTRTITVYNGVGIPTAPTGNSDICENSPNTQHTTLAVNNATSYRWVVSPSTAGTISGTGTTGTVNWNNTFTETATISVRAYSSNCGYSSYSDDETISITAIPNKPATPTGSIIMCQGTEQSTYSVTTVPGATGYQFTLSPSSAGVVLNSNNDNSCIIQWGSSFNGSANLSVRAYNECDYSEASNILVITVNPKPLQASEPTTIEDNLCQDSPNTLYTTTTTGNATSYLWTISPISAGSISGIGTTGTVNWSSGFYGAATINVRGVNACGNGENSTGITSIVEAIPSKATVPTGLNTLCQGAQNIIYNTEGAINSDSYTWELNPILAGTVVNNGLQAVVNLSVDFYGSATLRVRGVSCGNGDWSENLAITVNPLASVPEIPSGETELCQNAPNTSYTATADNADSYSWLLQPSSAGTITITGTTGIVNWRSDYSGTVELLVRAVNSCNASSYSPLLTIAVAPLPNTLSQPTGLTSLCQNAINTEYTIAEAANADSYTWSISPSAAGTVSGTGTIGTIDWAESFHGNANISVYGVNECGNSVASQALQVIIVPLPVKPNTPTGTISLCQNQTNISYSIPAVNYADSYEWELMPTTAGSVSYDVFLPSVMVNFNAAFHGEATLRVRGVSCGNGDWSDNLTIIVSPDVQTPQAPTGEVELCQNAVNTSYQINSVANASSYEWLLYPDNAGIITSTGVSGTVNWHSDFSGTARLSVRASNHCNTSAESLYLNVTVAPLPDIAPQPEGLTNICQNSINTPYIVDDVNNADTYNWILSPSSAGTISGTGTTGTVDWSENFQGAATISVNGSNECGEGLVSQTLQVMVNPIPEQPSTPTGSVSVCQGTDDFSYSIFSTAYATSYLWELSPIEAGSVVNNGLQAIINFSDDFHGTATLRVRGVSCGNGEWSDNLTITVNPSVISPDMPSGVNELPQNPNNTNYTISAVLHSTDYNWIINPTSAGVLQDNGEDVDVNWDADFSGVAQLSACAINNCNISSYSAPLLIEVLPLPDDAEQPIGLTSLCQNAINTEYTSLAISSATSYNWIIAPSSAGTISGIGLTAIVDWDSSFSGIAMISVQGINSQGSGNVSNSLAVQISPLPERASIPTGSSSICQGTQNILFSTLMTNYADSYEWEITPETCASIDGFANERFLFLDFNEAFYGNVSIRVRGVSCGYGEWSEELTFYVKQNVVTPDIPSGNISICQGAREIMYTTNIVPDASIYTFSLMPSNAGFITTENNTASINWSGDFAGDATLSVKAANSCSNSLFSDNLNINVIHKTGNAGGVHFIEDDSRELACQGDELHLQTSEVQWSTGVRWKVEPETAGTFSDSTALGPYLTVAEDHIGYLNIKVTGIGECGYSPIDAARQISIFDRPEKPIIETELGYCPNTIIKLHNTSYTGNSYIWHDHKDEIISTEDTLRKVLQNNNTIKVISENSQSNCSSLPTLIDLNIYDPSTANFTTFTDSIEAGTLCILNAFQSINVSEYLWKIDGEEYEVLTPEFNYYQSANGNYDVTLITTSKDGCTDSLTKASLIYVYGGVSGLSNSVKLNTLFVYPNPVKDVITIVSELSTTAKIIDITGRTVKSVMLSSGHNSIECHDLFSGTYILKVGNVTTLLLVE